MQKYESMFYVFSKAINIATAFDGLRPGYLYLLNIFSRAEDNEFHILRRGLFTSLFPGN
jgi:hypothetical protein